MKKLIALILAASCSMHAHSEISEKDHLRFQKWRANTHHELINCSVYYEFISLRMTTDNPAVSKKSHLIGDILLEQAIALGLDEQVTAARYQMAIDKIIPYHKMLGGLSVVMQENDKKCVDIVNGRVLREAKWWGDYYEKMTAK